MQRALLLDVVVRQRAAIFQLLTCEDQALLIRRDAFLVLDLALDAVNRVARLHIKGDGLASHRLGEDLHATDLHHRVARSLGARATAGTLVGDRIRIKGVLGVEPEHVGVMVIPEGHDEHSSVSEGIINCLHATLLKKVGAILGVYHPILEHGISDGVVLVAVD